MTGVVAPNVFTQISENADLSDNQLATYNQIGSSFLLPTHKLTQNVPATLQDYNSTSITLIIGPQLNMGGI